MADAAISWPRGTMIIIFEPRDDAAISAAGRFHAAGLHALDADGGAVASALLGGPVMRWARALPGAAVARRPMAMRALQRPSLRRRRR